MTSHALRGNFMSLDLCVLYAYVHRREKKNRVSKVDMAWIHV